MRATISRALRFAALALLLLPSSEAGALTYDKVDGRWMKVANV